MEFYVRRVRRIFPALVLVLVCSLAFGWLVLMADEYKQLGMHTAGGAGFVQNLVLWRESGYFDNLAETKPMLHLWSLAVEEQFYIFWPLLLAFVWKRQWNFLKITAAIGAVSFLANLYLMHRNPIAAFYLPISRFWELMIGGVLAYVVLHRPQLIEMHKKGQSILGFLLIAAGLILVNKGRDFPGWWALLPTLGAFFVISAGPNAWLNQKLLSNKVTVWIGLISYPLYLWHWVLLSYLRIIDSGDAPDLDVALAVALAVLLAWLTYQFVEKPVRGGGNRTFKVIALCGLMLLVGVSGAVLPRVDTRTEPAMFFNPAGNVEANRLNEKHHDISAYVSLANDDRQVAIRSPYCHYNLAGQTFEQYKNGMGKCLAIDGSKKNILIIGDSHAADLYVALSTNYSEFNFLQVTGASCTPVLSVHKPGTPCYSLINYGLEFASNNRLDAVIVAARWTDGYDDIATSISRIRQGNSNIYLVGPPVEFTADAHRVILRSREPLSKSRFLDKTKILINNQLKSMAAANNLHFIDRISLYCGADLNCPIVSNDGELLVVDYGHLTGLGARYLGSVMRRHGSLSGLE